MIKVDLVTGFLGAGKTTFIKKYANYIMSTGCKIGILENDHGAINVDMLLLNDLRGEQCELEMVAGGCDIDCHRRRFKTKLISMAMSGYERVIVEPSGIFDVDEFLDALREEPLDNWYEIGNIFCVIDASMALDLSDRARFMLASQVSCAGSIIFSHIKKELICDETSYSNIAYAYSDLVDYINDSLEKISCNRKITAKDIFIKDWNNLSTEDYSKLINSGYILKDYIKKYNIENMHFSTLMYMNLEDSLSSLREKIDILFSDSAREQCGEVFRIKGFVEENSIWYEINASKDSITVNEISVGQNVLIVIGENLIKDEICKVIGASTAEDV